MYVITGGAGFIGSNMAAVLERRGEQVLIVDVLDSDAKAANIAKRSPVKVVAPDALFDALDKYGSQIDGVIHMGAISSTTVTDRTLLHAINLELPTKIWTWCAEHDVALIYASTAAVYGDGGAGFKDTLDPAALEALRPLNPYGDSKLEFDKWVSAQVGAGRPAPPHWAGLRFFNVYGPNEYHKGAQASVALTFFEQIAADGPARLFASPRPDIPDGGQMRDFVWIGDCVDVMCWMLDRKPENGIYNVGSGEARSFADMAHAVASAMDVAPRIEFIAMPDEIAAAYQYRTLADITRLRGAGYNASMATLEEGVGRYVRGYLASDDRYV